MYSNVLTFFKIKYHFKMHKKMAPTVTFGESCHTSTMFWLLGFVSAITSVRSFSLFLRLSYGSEHYFCIAVASLVILQLLLTFYKLNGKLIDLRCLCSFFRWTNIAHVVLARELTSKPGQHQISQIKNDPRQFVELPEKASFLMGSIRRTGLHWQRYM